jgi:hypothetical protein
MWVNQSVTYVGELDHHRVHRGHREEIEYQQTAQTTM